VSLYDKPKPAAPPKAWSNGRVLAPTAEMLLANRGQWFAIGESPTHNGLGTTKNRLAALVPGVELVGRKDYDRNVVVLYARAPEVPS
jgi:hypothetical protein